MSAIKRWKDKRASGLASPFWYLKFDYKGRNVREPSGVLIGTKAEQKRTKKEAEQVEQGMRDQIDREIAQAEKDQESGFTKGALKVALEKHLHTRIMTGTKVVAAKERGEDVTRMRQVQSFESTMRVILRRFGADRLLDDIRDVDINAWRDDMLTGGKLVPAKGEASGAKVAVEGRGLKKSTINHRLTTLKTVMTRAHREWRMLKMVPTFTKEKMPRRKAQALEDHEIDAALAAARSLGKHVERYFLFMLFTGARKTEALVLTWKRGLDLSGNGSAYVRFVDDTKNDKERRVRLPEGLRQMLLEMKAEQIAGGYEGDRVFAYLQPRRVEKLWIEPKSFNDAVYLIKRNSGVDLFKAHIMRHTFASRVLRKGRKLEEVRDLLGHEDIVTTQIYASFVQDNLDEAVAVLDGDWKRPVNDDGARPAAAAS